MDLTEATQRILDRLERRGLIERRVNPGDRRSSLLVPTRAGLEAAREVAAVFDAIEARALAEVTADDLLGFESVMAAIERIHLKVLERGAAWTA